MSTNDKELALDELEEIEINFDSDEQVAQDGPLDEGLDLSLSEDDGGFELSETNDDVINNDDDDFGDLSLSDEEDDGDDLSLLADDEEAEEERDPETFENLGELSFDETPDLPLEDDGLSLATFDMGEEESLALSEDEGEVADLGSDEDDMGLSLSGDLDALSLDEDSFELGAEADLSEDAKEKLKEIDAIMDLDASQVHLSAASLNTDENLDEPLVSDDLDLGNFDFGVEEQSEPEVKALDVTPKETKKKKKEAPEAPARDLGQDLREISGAYSGEMERMQATISNLRADREELLAKIQSYEEEKMLGGRQGLTLRAELDEKKIELTIIRKKLNEEISDLKDRLKLFDEKRLILEEKNRILTQELEKASHKNKMDVKRVQMRERELEQKLELLKSDAESQIRHRDLKILELKRKIDAMEFDMESISMQEKRSVESRFELEDKLEKAIKTLRGAITVLEDESDRSNALDALKKNIDM